jgi:acyl-CoA thioester hydrolase
MEAAEAWALETTIRVAWGDMDAFAHVNHTVYLRWFETARIEWFELVEFPEDGHLGPILKTASAVYEAQVKYPDTVVVRVRAETPGRTSVKLVYEVESAAHGGVVARGESVVVLVEGGRPTPIPDELRARFARKKG